MKICITGIAGFIGFHTAIRFTEMGHEVFGFDNFNDFIYDSDLKYARKEKLSEYNVNVTELDLKNELDQYIAEKNPDLIIHLAAHAGVRISMEYPQDYITNNISGTQNLISALEKNNIQNVIYASTSCTMEGNTLPWNPDEKLGKQLSPYGFTKQTNEQQFHTSKIENAVCLRFFTVYGPWGRPDMALFGFTKNILNDKPITVFNNGNMIRDFTYVDDIVQGIVLVSKNMSSRETYCIGNGNQVNLMDFISEIENNIGKEAIKEYAPQHPADALETWSDTSKLQKLGYKPNVDVTEGVKNFVQWYRNYHGKNS